MDMEKESIESQDIRIEKARPEDARGIQEVFYRSWLETYPNEKAGVTIEDIEDRFKDGFSEERLAKRAGFFAAPPEDETWLIAKKDDIIVGLISPIRKSDRNQLQRVYVHPDYFHQGIGMKLWEAAKGYMDMGKDTYVELVDYNESAKHFYEKLGFVDTGRRWPSTTLLMKSGANPTEMEMVLRADPKVGSNRPARLGRI